MSRAAIIVVARHFLHHDPSPDEYEAARKLLLSLCPGGRLYIPSEAPTPSLFNDAADLRANGWSIRKIAKKLGISKSQVHRELSRETVATVDTDPHIV